MKDQNNKKQVAVQIGDNNSITQNFIHLYSSNEPYNTSYIKTDMDNPRSRLQICSKLSLQNMSDTSEIAEALKMCVKWIPSIQNSDCGLPTDDKGSESCAWASAGLLWSYWVATGNTPIWWRKCLRWILAQTNVDGGIPIVTKGDNSITDATAFTLLCTSVAGNDYIESSKRFASWLLETQLEGGWKWSMKSKNYNYISTGLAILALKYYVLSNKDIDEGILTSLFMACRWLIKERNLDCGWGSHPGDISRPANTGFILYVLSVVGYEEECNESLIFLKKSFSEHYGWDNSVDRPASHSVTRLGNPYTLLGLSSMRPSEIRDELLVKGFKILLSNYDNGTYSVRNTVARSWPTRDFVFSCSSMIG